MTILHTSTPFGIVRAEFGPEGAPAVTGPKAAVDLLAERMRYTPDHQGMMTTLDSCDPIGYLHVTATCGFGIVPMADPSTGGEEFDAEDEFGAMPAVAVDDALDGDFPGHPFRGNQYVKASAQSRSAVNSSIRAKAAEGKGDHKAKKAAHRTAYHAHMAAASEAKGKAKSYHKTMAKFHKRQGGVMDSVDDDEADDVAEVAPPEGDKAGKKPDAPKPEEGEKAAKAGEEKAMDAVDHEWHTRTMEKFRGYSEAQLRYVIKDATEAADAGETFGNSKVGQYRDEAHYASMELQRRRKGGKQGDPFDPRKGPMHPTGRAALDSAADEWPAELAVVLDGDFPGHPFRGNQHVSGDAVSAGASSASRHVKGLEQAHGPTHKKTRSAHAEAARKHKAAHKGAKTAASKDYHAKMAAFHRGRASGVKLDSVADWLAEDDSAALDSVAEVPGLRAALRASTNPMVRVGIMRDIMMARDTDNNVSAPGIANATPAALEMLAMARTSGRQDNAYASALALERGIKSESGGLMYVDWDTADPASVPVMDSADLFGDEKAGHYLVGRLSTKRGVVIGSIYIRGDGMAMYRPSMVDEAAGEYWGQDGLRDVEDEGGGEDWQEFVGWRGDMTQLAQDIAEIGAVANTAGMADADNRNEAVMRVLEREGWSNKRGVAELEDEDKGTLTIIEAEFDGPYEPIVFSIVQTNDAGGRVVRSLTENPEHDAQTTADLLIMEVNAMQPEQRLSAADAQQIAKTILQQLGGGKFTTMTGAKAFTSLSDGYGGVQFSLPTGFSQVNGKSTGINRVIIRLNASDTYDVEFGAARISKAKGAIYKVIAKSGDVYADSLREVFTRYTGLDTSLGSMRGARSGDDAETQGMKEAAMGIALAKLESLGWKRDALGSYAKTVNDIGMLARQSSDAIEVHSAGTMVAATRIGPNSDEGVASVVSLDKSATEWAGRQVSVAAAVVARLGELGWAPSRYADVVKYSMVRSFVGVGPTGTMVTPDGTRNFYVNMTDNGTQFVAKFGDDILANLFIGRTAEEGRATAEALNAAVEKVANEGRAKNGLPPVGAAGGEAQEDWTPFEHGGLKIAPTNMRNGDGTVSRRWQVQTPENAEREKRGERQIGGDALTSTREDAIKRADEMLREDASRKAREAEADAAAAERAAAEAARKAKNGGKSINELSADKTLEKLTQEGGQVMTRRAWVEAKVAEGLKPKVTQENRIQPMSRAQFNRASNEEQRAHERKIAAAGKKDVYWIGDYSVSKTEHDYAVSLASKASEPAAPTDERAAVVAELQTVIDGTHPSFTSSEYLDRLADLYEKWSSDPELEALLNRAAESQSNALLAEVSKL